MTWRASLLFRPFTIVLALAVMVAFLPRSALRWTNDTAAVLLLPVTPLGDVGMDIREFFRPVQEPTFEDGMTESELRDELLRFKAAYRNATIRIDQLLDRLAQLEQTRQVTGIRPFTPVFASIVGDSSMGGQRTVRLNVGSSHNVTLGTVAVHNGVYLVGRVSQMSPLTSLLTPINDPEIGYIEAYVETETDEAARLGEAPTQRARVLLEADGAGGLVGDVGADEGVAIGDEVICLDPTWPATSHGMVVGRVDSVEERRDNPLRVRIRVVPMVRASQLASVTLKVERAGEDEAQ